MEQRNGALVFAAAGTPLNAAPTERPLRPGSGRLKLAAGNAMAASKQASQLPPPTTCQQCLTLGFFFDGTGNNLDADVGTMQHSNVARLFQSHPLDDSVLNRFSFYVPGLGTYFSEIGDRGNTTRGRGMGHMGQDRINWAFKKFDEVIKQAEARAQNPTNKILSIKVSVFGFSRGATAARAFVRDLAQRCNVKSGEYRLKQGDYPVEVIFLGIFDTVASVGMPMSGNNTPGATSLGWYATQTTVDVRAGSPTNGILAMAFGEPGADPAPGSFDGHASWADGLEVPALVKRCVHMVSGHEMRNSFPVDSALFGQRYPDGVAEMVYPGVHSDVGGGYQPGEGARSAHPGEMLSLIPLRAMHQEARSAGVPLLSIDALAERSALLKRSFALDDEGSKKFDEMNALFGHYMQLAGSGGRDIGRELLAHSSWYLRWRFFNARRNQRAGGQGPDANTIAQREPGFAAERKRIAADVARLEGDWAKAREELDRAQYIQQNAQMAQARFGLPIQPDVKQRLAQATENERLARDAHLREKSKLDTYADDSALAGNMTAYERRLVQDAEAITAHQKKNPKLTLRPHYRNLIDAYNAQYLSGDPLDEKLVAFFDRYVHDSLAGFATDATLPSDPRVIYAGGDNKIRYAGLTNDSSEPKRMAA
jgi:Uncharacterized alpha/beta hydrolase domain (DUF2235)